MSFTQSTALIEIKLNTVSVKFRCFYSLTNYGSICVGRCQILEYKKDLLTKIHGFCNKTKLCKDVT
jgi:hypothetical protein